MDINEKLLAAFQVEHVEHLEGVRACLAQWAQTGQPVAVDEAYRRTHSLKGAARVTGLTPVEALAHRLESLFARVRDGKLTPDKRLLRVVHAALNAIEDSAACLLAGRAAPDGAQTLAEIEGLLTDAETGPPTAELPKPATRNPRLWTAFQEEQGLHVDGMRRVVAQRKQGDSAENIDVDEAFRCANSLHGAARLAQSAAVAALAQRLEAIFSRVLQKQMALDEQVLFAVERALTAIAQVAPQPEAVPDHPSTAAALRACDELLAGRTGPQAVSAEASPTSPVAPMATAPPAARQASDTVRLSAECLDQLLQSSGRLMTENLQQDSLGSELDGVHRQLATISREWQTLQRTSGGGLRRLIDSPEGGGVGRFLDMVEHEVGALVRRVRAARALHKQSAWSVKQLAEQVQEDVRRARLIPAENEYQSFRKMMRDLARDEGKELEFRVSGLDVLADRMVLQALKDPLMHILRNAVSHGIEPPALRTARGKSSTGEVSLELRAIGNRLTISVADDGRGIDLLRIQATAVERGLLTDADATTHSSADLIRLVFQPGFSTASTVTDLSGRGLGLSVAYETVTRLQGEIELAARDGAGAMLTISVPLSISTHRLLLVKAREQTFAIPASGVEGLCRVSLSEIQSVAGQPMVELHGHLMPLCGLSHLLDPGGGADSLETDILQLVVVRAGGKRLAVAVDELIAHRNALIKPLGPPANRLAIYAGGAVLEDGTVSLVLNPAELLDRRHATGVTTRFVAGQPRPASHTPSILVVDDSFTTRTLETSLLETNGYQVRVAVDGVEALSHLRAEKFDLVISDLQMPRLDGFGLIEEMKRDSRLARIPVIVVSSLDSREDQERGLRLGADAYIVKKKFDHQELLKVIQQIL